MARGARLYGCRQAAFELRQRAADAFDETAKLDGMPAMRLLRSDVERIPAAIGVDPDRLTDIVMGIWPGTDSEVPRTSAAVPHREHPLARFCRVLSLSAWRAPFSMAQASDGSG